MKNNVYLSARLIIHGHSEYNATNLSLSVSVLYSARIQREIVATPKHMNFVMYNGDMNYFLF